MGKGEIARYEHFPLFPRCFQKACFPEVSKGVIVWEWVKHFTIQQNFRVGQIDCILRHYSKCSNDISVSDRVKNIVGKGENAGYPFSPQCFSKASFSGLLKLGIVWFKVEYGPRTYLI